MVMGESDRRQAGAPPSHSDGGSITVTEREFCKAVSDAVTDYFHTSKDCADAQFAGLPIAIDAYDRLRGVG